MYEFYKVQKNIWVKHKSNYQYITYIFIPIHNTNVYTHTDIYTHIHIHTHTYIYIHTLTHTYMYTNTHEHTFIFTYIQIVDIFLNMHIVLRGKTDHFWLCHNFPRPMSTWVNTVRKKRDTSESNPYLFLQIC